MRQITFAVLIVTLACLVPAAAQDCVGAFTQRGSTLMVLPTGVNDTNHLQCAFLTAANKQGMTIQLGTGTYYIGTILAQDFYGTFKGEGIGKTKVRNPESPVYVMSAIGCNEWGPDCLPIQPTLANPYPAMFTFLNGSFEVSDLSVQVIGSEPTTGWSIVGAQVKGFQSVFLVDGPTGTAKNTSATFRRVEVVGEPAADYFSYNVWMPICFGGWFNYEPLSGNLLVTDSTMRGTGTSTTVQNVSNAGILITHNTYETVLYGPDVTDLKNTKYLFTQNKVIGAGLAAWTGASGCDLLFGNCGIKDSTVKFVANSLEGASGVLIDGPMDANSTCNIVGNTLLAPEPSVLFTATSQNCTAVLSENDTFEDNGTGNKVMRTSRR